MKKIKLLIVDDHKMIREGISSMLELYNDKYNFVVDVAETGVEAIKKSAKIKYDIIIMDYQMPIMNGVAATKEILHRDPSTKILAISNYDEYANITSMLDVGSRGFILKNISSDELIVAIDAVLNNKKYYSSDVAVKLIDKPLNKEKKQNPLPSVKLSKRELEILKLITHEYTNQRISVELGLSKRTVDKHRQHLLEKLNTNNTVGLIKKALELNLFN